MKSKVKLVPKFLIKKVKQETPKKKDAFNPVLKVRDMSLQARDDGSHQMENFLPNE